MSRGSVLGALVESSAAEWVLILSLVFGGCCSSALPSSLPSQLTRSNVVALESILRNHPRSGTLITFAQFVYVAFQNLSSQLYIPPGKGLRVPSLRKRAVPMKRWVVQVVLFLGVSLSQSTLGLVMLTRQ